MYRFILIAFAAFLSGIYGCSKKNNAPAVTPDFTYTGTLRVDYAVSFHSNITNATSYKWDFGDGGYSTDATPAHTYSTASSFIVTLIVNNDTAHKASKTITIDPAVDFSIIGTPTAGYILGFSSTAPSGSTFLWDFGDGNTSTAAYPTHIYAANGTYNVTLEINNDAGHIIQKTLKVFANGIYLNLIPTGTVIWRHIFSYNATSSSYHYADTLSDTSMAITFVAPYSITIGSDTMTYLMSQNGDSVLVFNVDPPDPAHYILVYNVYFNRYTSAITFDKLHFTGVSGGSSHDLYYNP